VPTYWNGVKDVLSPYVAEVSEKLWAASSYVWESTQPARSQLSDVVTIVLVRVSDTKSVDFLSIGLFHFVGCNHQFLQSVKIFAELV